jgi:RNA polymerase sigma-70 factor (ECF subfamily)
MLSSSPPGPAAASAASDADLIVAVAARDRGAFVALFDRYAGRVKGFALRRGASPADADEIAQDVMVAIWRRAETFDPARASAAAWIYAIARNRRIDFARRAARHDPRTGPDPLDPFFQPDPEPDGVAIIDAAEREARLRDALAGLAAEQRRVVAASFFDGLSHSEIAVREGVPLGTVKSRIRLAFRHLHAVLGVDVAEGFGND